MAPFSVKSLKSLSSSSLSRLLDKDPNFQRTFKDDEEREKYLHRFDGQLYPKNVSRRLVATSCCMSYAAIQAIYWECYLACVSVIMVVLISINFWRKPTRGTRRNIDIVNSCSVCLFHMVYASIYLDEATAAQYVVMVLGGLVFYGSSKIASKHGFLDLDSLFHGSMHLYGTFVNCWIYPRIYEYVNQSSIQ